MSISNFQWQHDGLRWRIKLMRNTPITSLFYCRARDGHDTFIFRRIRGGGYKVEIIPEERNDSCLFERVYDKKEELVFDDDFIVELEVVKVLNGYM